MNPWTPISKPPKDGSFVILEDVMGKIWKDFNFDLGRAKKDSVVRWQPYVAPEPDDGFESWWNSLPKNPNRSAFLERSGCCIYKETAREIWTAAQAAMKGGSK